MLFFKQFHLLPGSAFPWKKLALSTLLVITSACNLPAQGAAKTDEPVDPAARTYRMYFDRAAGGSASDLQVRTFPGQLQLADLQAVFGDLDALPKDEYGNTVGGPLLKDGLLWSLVLSPSGAGANLVTSGLDGTTSSAIDLDGDRVADIVDMRLGDGRRFSFATEELGMGVFEHWLQGGNPLCNDPLSRQLGLADFGCGGSAGGSSGGANGASPDSGFVDPLDAICAEYNTSGSRRLVAGVNRANQNYSSYHITDYETNLDGSRVPRYHEATLILYDSSGQYSGTYKFIEYYDSSGRVIERIEENIDSDGNGERVITDYPADGRTTTRRQRISVDSEEMSGDYTAGSTTPPRLGPYNNPNYGTGDEEPAGEAPPDPPPPLPPATEGDPGPEGDDSAVAAFCARRGNTTSGVEQAAATDPSAFRVGCGDLVGAPSPGNDCTIIEWAAPQDFDGTIETPQGDDGCGEFEQPGPGGDCEPTNAIATLRGRTALLASAHLQGLVLCPPIVCNPAFAAGLAAVRQEISSNDLAPDALGDVPGGEGDSGQVTVLSLCNQGPGPGYKTVSALKVGQVVKIVGIGAQDGWLVVDNPLYPGESCWVEQGALRLDPGFDPARYPVISAPASAGGAGGPGGSGAGCQDPYYYSPNTGKCELFE